MAKTGDAQKNPELFACHDQMIGLIECHPAHGKAERVLAGDNIEFLPAPAGLVPRTASLLIPSWLVARGKLDRIPPAPVRLGRDISVTGVFRQQDHIRHDQQAEPRDLQRLPPAAPDIRDEQLARTAPVSVALIADDMRDWDGAGHICYKDVMAYRQRLVVNC